MSYLTSKILVNQHNTVVSREENNERKKQNEETARTWHQGIGYISAISGGGTAEFNEVIVVPIRAVPVLSIQ